MKKLKAFTISAPLAIIALIALIAVGGYLIYVIYQSKQVEKVETPAVISEIPKPLDTSESPDISNDGSDKSTATVQTNSRLNNSVKDKFVFLDRNNKKLITISPEDNSQKDLIDLSSTLSENLSIREAVYDRINNNIYALIKSDKEWIVKKFNSQGTFIKDLLVETIMTEDNMKEGKGYFYLSFGELSPNGRYINVTGGMYEGSFTKLISTEDGSKLTDAECNEPTWSASGKRLVFASSGGLCTGNGMSLSKIGDIKNWEKVDFLKVESQRTLTEQYNLSSQIVSAPFIEAGFLNDNLIVASTEESSQRVILYNDQEKTSRDLIVDTKRAQLIRLNDKIIVIDGIGDQLNYFFIDQKGSVSEKKVVQDFVPSDNSETRKVLTASSDFILIKLRIHNSKEDKLSSYSYGVIEISTGKFYKILEQQNSTERDLQFILAESIDQGY